MTATKIQPGDDLHLTSLMAPHSLNLVTGQDRAALLAYGRDVFAAARDSKCLAQIEEPAQPVSPQGVPAGEIVLFGGDLKEVSWAGGKMPPPGTKLYAGAAPAAAAGTVEDHSAVLVAARDLISLRTEYAQKTQNAMPGNEYWGTRFDAKYQALAAALAAAPALEAPAAPLDDSELEDLAHSANQECLSFGMSLDPFLRLAKTVRNRMQAAAPQAPAAPSPYSADLLATLGQWHQRCEVMGAHHTLTETQIAELVVAGLLRRAHGGQVITTAGRAALAAPAAPAVDAEPLDVCTDPYNCARCKTHPAHRGDMHHAGISGEGGSA